LYPDPVHQGEFTVIDHIDSDMFLHMKTWAHQWHTTPFVNVSPSAHHPSRSNAHYLLGLAAGHAHNYFSWLYYRKFYCFNASHLQVQMNLEAQAPPATGSWIIVGYWSRQHGTWSSSALRFEWLIVPCWGWECSPRHAVSIWNTEGHYINSTDSLSMFDYVQGMPFHHCCINWLTCLTIRLDMQLTVDIKCSGITSSSHVHWCCKHHDIIIQQYSIHQ
jgi:hypothetical protein